MSEADYDAIEARLQDHTLGITGADIAYLLARVRRYEAALRHIGVDGSECDTCMGGLAPAMALTHVEDLAAAALADDAQPPAEEKA